MQYNVTISFDSVEELAAFLHEKDLATEPKIKVETKKHGFKRPGKMTVPAKVIKVAIPEENFEPVVESKPEQAPVVKPEQAPEIKQETKQPQAPEVKQEVTQTLTLAEVGAILKELNDKKGIQAAIKALAEFKTARGFNVTRISELEKKDYAAFFVLCNDLIKQA